MTPSFVTVVDCPASSVSLTTSSSCSSRSAVLLVFTALSDPELLMPVVDTTTSVAMLAVLVVVVGAGGSCAELDLSIGTDRVEHQGIHARREVDVSARDQIKVLEVDRLDHVAAHAADAVLPHPPR